MSEEQDNLEEHPVLEDLAAVLFNELFQYERFQKFIALNYQIHLLKNESGDVVDVKIIENDSSLVQQQIVEEARKKLEEQESEIVVAPADTLDKLNDASCNKN